MFKNEARRSQNRARSSSIDACSPCSRVTRTADVVRKNPISHSCKLPSVIYTAIHTFEKHGQNVGWAYRLSSHRSLCTQLIWVWHLSCTAGVSGPSPKLHEGLLGSRLGFSKESD